MFNNLSRMLLNILAISRPVLRQFVPGGMPVSLFFIGRHERKIVSVFDVGCRFERAVSFDKEFWLNYFKSKLTIKKVNCEKTQVFIFFLDLYKNSEHRSKVGRLFQIVHY